MDSRTDSTLCTIVCVAFIAAAWLLSLCIPTQQPPLIIFRYEPLTTLTVTELGSIRVQLAAAQQLNSTLLARSAALQATLSAV